MDFESLFFSVAGVPLHPLIVHFVVVLIPLSSLGLLLAVFFKRIRSKFLGLSVLGLAVSAPLTWVAGQSGEALTEVRGEPDPHVELGELLVPISWLLFAAGLLYWIAVRRRVSRPFMLAASSVAVLTAVGVTGLTIAVGHSGADATWSGVVESVEPSED
jgi:uncharacterized membrane protein